MKRRVVCLIAALVVTSVMGASAQQEAEAPAERAPSRVSVRANLELMAGA